MNNILVLKICNKIIFYVNIIKYLGCEFYRLINRFNIKKILRLKNNLTIINLFENNFFKISNLNLFIDTA